MSKHPSDSTIRRQQLIAATIETIAEHGLSSVTLSKVASQSGMSAGIVNFYFKTKRQLLVDTLQFLDDEYTEVIEQCVSAAQSAEQRLDGYVRGSFDQRIFTRQKSAVWFAFWSETHAREDYRRICAKSERFTSELVRQCFSELIGDLNGSNSKAESLAAGLEGLIDRLWQKILIEPDDIDSVSAVVSCENYIKSVLPNHSIEPKPPHIDSQLSDLLPFWTYRDEELFELEIEKLFKPNWMLVGHISEIPNCGDYMTFQGFGERALVVRNKTGKINAFHNICRHRGSTILVGQGRCRQSLTCPFHGWRYDYDGQVQFIPGKQGFPDVDPSAYSLVPLDLEVWNGFVFIRFSPGGESLEDMLRPIQHEVEEYRLEEVQPYQEPKRYASNNPDRLNVNWKIFHDIDNEGYHVPIGHPSLQQLYGKSYIDTYVNEIPLSHGYFNESFGHLWSVRNYRKLLPKFEHLSANRQNLWFYFGVFPNLVFALYPDMMEIYMSIPVSIDRTDVISKCYALPDKRRGIDALRYLNRRINAATGKEDYFYMDSMQEGLRSSAYPQWTLSETAETGIRAYHRAIQAALPVTRLSRQPTRGTIFDVNESMSQA